MKAAHGHVVNVKPIPTRQVTRIEIEIPVEHHVAATEMLFNRDVLVTLAPLDMKGHGYGVLDGEQPERDEEPRNATEAAGRVPLGPLARSAVMVCKEPKFQQFVSENNGHDSSEVDAAEYVKHRCGVTTRKDIDKKDGAKERFGALMSDYRLWQDRL